MVRWSTAWRAGLLQLVSVGVLAVASAVALPHSAFEDWGWLIGPGTWALCAVLVARVLRLPVLMTLVGALLSGLPQLAGVLAGVHWAGGPAAILLFGAWCGWLAARSPEGQVRDFGRRRTATA